MNALQKARSLIDTLRAEPNSPKADEHWALAGRLLSRLTPDQNAVQRAVDTKDLAALDALVGALERPAAPAAAEPTFSTDELERALKAFKHRINVTRLDDESRLGNRYTTGGRKSEIDAIMPPSEFPAAIWKALARAGKIRDAGRGFYAER